MLSLNSIQLGNYSGGKLQEMLATIEAQIQQAAGEGS